MMFVNISCILFASLFVFMHKGKYNYRDLTYMNFKWSIL